MGAENNPSATPHCAVCGKPLTGPAPGSVCPACALQDALAHAADPATPGLFFDDLPRAGETHGRLGPFELIEPLARGGMGIVYKARQPALNRIVAVKVLLGGEHASAEFKQRFRQEAEAAARLQHPNIVTVFDIGEHCGVPYFAMEYVEGHDLDQLVRIALPPPERAAAWLQSAADTMAVAHQNGIWHRDLKPSNLILAGDGRLRVTDFGLVRLPEEMPTLTRTGQAMGSPGFLPPEQISAKRGGMGAHSDVYALGAVLYFVLTGRAPFQTSGTAEAFHEVLNHDPIPPRRLNPSVPRDLETIALKCLEKEPHRRYTGARELAGDLGRFLRGEPITARRSGLGDKLRKWARRKPAVAALTSILALVAVGAGAGLAWQWGQVRAAEERLAQWGGQRMERAATEFLADRPRRAMAQLVEAVRAQPGHALAVRRLMAALTDRGHLLPTALPGPSTRMLGARLSPDGTRLLTVAEGEVLTVWDLGTGNRRASWPHPGKVAVMDFSHDGRVIYTLARDTNEAGSHAARVWDAGSGEPRSPRLESRSPPADIRLSPDAGLVTLAGRDGSAVGWEVPSGRKTRELPGGDGATAISLSRDGRWLARATRSREVQVWDLATDLAPGPGWTSAVPVVALACEAGGKRVAGTGPEGTAVWETATGRVLMQTNGLAGRLVAFNVAGDRLLVSPETAGNVVTARLLDPATGRVEGTLTNVSFVEAVPLGSPSGLIVGATGPLVRLYSDRDGRTVTDPFDCGRIVDQASLDPGGNLLLVTTHENKLMGFRRRENRRVETGIPLDPGPRAVSFSEDGSRFAVSRENGTVEVRESRAGQILTRLALAESGPVTVAFSNDGAWLAVATTNRQVRIWDLGRGQPAGGALEFPDVVGQMRFSPDDGRLLAATRNTVHVFDWQSAQPDLAPWPLVPKVRPDPPWQGPLVLWTEFSPDGQRLLAGCFYDAALIWDVADRRVTAVLEQGGPVVRAHFSPDGKRVITAGADGNGRIWDLDTGRLAAPLLPHERPVFEAWLTAEGRRAITASLDGTARVWDARTGRRLAETSDHGDELRGMLVSPDGECFATVTRGARLQVWDTTTGLPVSEAVPNAWRTPTLAWRRDEPVLAYHDWRWGVEELDVRPWPLPVPGWIPELADAVMGYPAPPVGPETPVPVGSFLALKARILGLPETRDGPYIRWARWFFGEDPAGKE